MTINSILEEIRNYKKENSRVRRRRKVTCTLSCDQTRDSYLTLFHILSEAFLDIQDLLLIAPTPHNVALSTTKHSID